MVMGLRSMVVAAGLVKPSFEGCLKGKNDLIEQGKVLACRKYGKVAAHIYAEVQ